MSGPHTPPPVPTELTLDLPARVLRLRYADGRDHALSFEMLRVHSPSAEVKGHGPGQEVLQVGKRNVLINGLEPVGNYAIRPVFSDGHDTGIYSWAYLHQLCTQHDALWADYLARLERAGAQRD